MNFTIFSIFLSLAALFGEFIQAEPYLSNRYAQNCAACHSPGRLNRPAAGRRCTLSCQGCHVNPQGGGMRNQYGIWNQQRWLRSFRSDFFRDKPTPAPLDHQPYADRVKQLASRASEFYGGRRPQFEIAKSDSKNLKTRNSRNESTTMVNRTDDGKIVWIKGTEPDLKFYDKNSYSEWHAVVDNNEDFESAIPDGDPYHLERDLSVYASGDFRYFYLNTDKANILDGKKTRSALMAADIGVRMRPTKYHQFSAVVEARFANAPTNQDLEDGFSGGAQAKAAYLMIDDLAYNSFVQAGLYRPMFGHYDPDHNSLSSEITGFTQQALYKGYAVGTAPNVPFFIVNVLQPYLKDGDEYETTDGLTATAGLRFVTLGASAAFSYWDTKYTTISGPEVNKRKMLGFTGGFTIKDYILNFEMIRVEKSNSLGAKNAGSVITIQNKYRIYKEIYAVFNLANANTARDLSSGRGTDTEFGAKAFLNSNVEFELLMINRKLTESSTDVSYSLTQAQAHIFF